MADIVLQLLAAVGGIGVIIIALAKFGSSILSSWAIERSRRATERDLEFSRHRLTLDRFRAEKFLATQFEAYHLLWKSLQSLRTSADVLWNQATPDNIASFAKRLRETTAIVRDGAIFFDEQEYAELTRLLRVFSDFDVGKRRILTIRNSKEVFGNAFLLLHQLSHNLRCKEEFECLLEDIRIKFRERLSRLPGESA